MAYPLTTSEGVLAISLAGEPVRLFGQNSQRRAMYIFNLSTTLNMWFGTLQSMDTPFTLFTLSPSHGQKFLAVDYGTALQNEIWFMPLGGAGNCQATQYLDQ